MAGALVTVQPCAVISQGLKPWRRGGKGGASGSESVRLHAEAWASQVGSLWESGGGWVL